MKKLTILALAAFTVAAILFAVRIRPVAAHEPRPIGPYQVEFGWSAEPAYAGVYNSAELFISMKDDTTKKVEGAEQTLKLEVSFGGKSKTLPLQPADEDPGHYYAPIIPTRAGDYSFHLSGKIGDTAVDETFNSADGKFSSVEPASDVLFPDTQADMAGLQAQIDALKTEVEQLKAGAK